MLNKVLPVALQFRTDFGSIRQRHTPRAPRPASADDVTEAKVFASFFKKKSFLFFFEKKNQKTFVPWGPNPGGQALD
jgi:hypothetical protein